MSAFSFSKSNNGFSKSTNVFTDPPMASPKTPLKLLVDKKGQRVLFAEATKEFIDFLFHIFSLPLGTLIELLGSNQMVGCLGKLKDSVESFDDTYFQPGIKKDDIFNPKTPYNRNTFLFSNAPSAVPKPICRCSFASDHNPFFGGNSSFHGFNFASAENSSVPISRGSQETEEVTGSYVKELVKYMVMDDLVVKPMSTISTITIIKKLGVNYLSQLEEKMVSFGKDEALKLLKASLTNEKVLTSVFLENNCSIKDENQKHQLLTRRTR